MTRKDYEMTQEDLSILLAAITPTPYIAVTGGIGPSSVQERANRAWETLGNRMGFDHMSVRPTGRGDRFFSAEPK
jgi:hypothetical protein